MQIRQASPGDYRRLAELHILARYDMAYLPYVHSFPSVERWMREVVIPGQCVWVAEVDSIVVGYASLLAAIQSRDLQAAARDLGLQLHFLEASTNRDLDTVFPEMGKLGAQALVVTSDSFFFSQSEQIAALATRHKLPAIYGFRESAAAGGLMSYGGTLGESHRWIGVYTGQISKGREAGQSAPPTVDKSRADCQFQIRYSDWPSSPARAGCSGRRCDRV